MVPGLNPGFSVNIFADCMPFMLHGKILNHFLWNFLISFSFFFFFFSNYWPLTGVGQDQSSLNSQAIFHIFTHNFDKHAYKFWNLQIVWSKMLWPKNHWNWKINSSLSISYGAFRLLSFCMIVWRLLTLVFCVATQVTHTNIHNAQSCCERLALADMDWCTPMKSRVDLNLLDLNHWFKSRFKSIDFFIRISDLNQYFWFVLNYGQIKAVLVKSSSLSLFWSSLLFLSTLGVPYRSFITNLDFIISKYLIYLWIYSRFYLVDFFYLNVNLFYFYCIIGIANS